MFEQASSVAHQRRIPFHPEIVTAGSRHSVQDVGAPTTMCTILATTSADLDAIDVEFRRQLEATLMQRVYTRQECPAGSVKLATDGRMHLERIMRR